LGCSSSEHWRTVLLLSCCSG